MRFKIYFRYLLKMTFGFRQDFHLKIIPNLAIKCLILKSLGSIFEFLKFYNVWSTVLIKQKSPP